MEKRFIDMLFEYFFTEYTHMKESIKIGGGGGGIAWVYNVQALRLDGN